MRRRLSVANGTALLWSARSDNRECRAADLLESLLQETIMSMSAADRQSMPGFLPLIGRSWWVLLVYGILGVIFGLFALARPLVAATAIVWAIGVLALAEGVVS